MIIPESTIQKIKDEADIVKIIGEYIKLEKKGANFMGLCPFHQDNNPSLTVSTSKKIYKCFSCGASGNVITFVQNYEKISFVKAVQIVGEKCGITVETDNDGEVRQNLDKYYQIMQNATNFYEFYLKNTSEGVEALNYLYKRKLNDEIIKRFRIGLAPKESDLLYKSLLASKNQPLDMIECGVVRSHEDKYYDVFRNRVMFPIEDINGNIVGFSGRLYQSKKTDEAKYVNSNENIIFKKSNILYNYHSSINEIRQKDQIFVFEGFMDVIAAIRADVNNVVATMGTSLTQNQIQAILKTTKNVVVCYDGDGPGIEATKKAILLFMKAGANVKAVLMPEGIDPDEYINANDEEKLKDYLINQSLNGIDYLYEVEKKGLNLSDITSIESFKTTIFKYLNLFHSNVLTERYLNKLSEEIQTSFESLKQDYQKTSFTSFTSFTNFSNFDNNDKFTKFNKYNQNNYGLDYAPIVDFIPVEIPKKKAKKTKYIRAERSLIKKIYYKKELCKDVESALGTHYVNEINRNIIFKLYDYYKQNEAMEDNKFCSMLTETEKEVLNELLKTESAIDSTELTDLISTIKTYPSEKFLITLKEKINDNKDDDSLVIQFSKTKKETIRNKKKE